MKKTLILVIYFWLTLLVSRAHQPRLVTSNSTLVVDPEISKAFYGILEGQEHRYTITVKDSFRLFVNIMVPNISSALTNFNVSIACEETGALYFLKGGDQKWTNYYEEFVGDEYLIGPYFRDETIEPSSPSKGRFMPGCKYEIVVSNPVNQGKYVLAIGDKESWPPGEVWNAVILLPSIKAFFEKGPLGYFTTPTTISFLLASLLAIAFLCWIIFKSIRTGFY